jgi:hypothetical protein
MDYASGIGFDVRRQDEVVGDGGRIHRDSLNSFGVSRYVFVVARSGGLAGLTLGVGLLRPAARAAASASGDYKNDAEH